MRRRDLHDQKHQILIPARSKHHIPQSWFFWCTSVEPVFKVFQSSQRRLEQQPLLFLNREITFLQQEARQALAAYLNTPAENLVFVPNATHGINIIARSLELVEGDGILISDHKYGAMDYTWEFIGKKTGAKIIRQPIPLPAHS